MELKITFNENNKVTKLLYSEGDIKDCELPFDSSDFEHLPELISNIINNQ